MTTNAGLIREALGQAQGDQALWDAMYPTEPTLSEVLTRPGLAAGSAAVKLMLRRAQVSAWHLYISDWTGDENAAPADKVGDLAAYLDDLDQDDVDPDEESFARGLTEAVETTVLMALGRRWAEDAKPLVEAICDHLRDYGDRWPRQMYVKAGHAIDCWSQATGIDVDNPTGCWEIVVGADAMGWKKPRINRAPPD